MPSLPCLELVPSLPSVNLATICGVDMCIACSVVVLIRFLLAPLYLVSKKSPFYHETDFRTYKTSKKVQRTKRGCRWQGTSIRRWLKEEAVEPDREVSGKRN